MREREPNCRGLGPEGQEAGAEDEDSHGAFHAAADAAADLMRMLMLLGCWLVSHQNMIAVARTPCWAVCRSVTQGCRLISFPAPRSVFRAALSPPAQRFTECWDNLDTAAALLVRCCGWSSCWSSCLLYPPARPALGPRSVHRARPDRATVAHVSESCKVMNTHVRTQHGVYTWTHVFLKTRT